MRYTIGEMAEIIDGDRGKNYPQQHEFLDEGYCLFLNTGNVTKAGFSFDSNQFISKEKCDLLRKGKLQRHDIVYTTRGTVGNAAFYSDSIPYEHVRINSGMVIIRPKETIVCTEFLYQILKSDYYRPFFRKYCTGSAQPQLPIKNFSTIELDLPDLPVQRFIAGILSSYDDLIENNQKQIKLLEEAAQRLYKEWFVDLRFPGHETTPIVDGVPEGWRKGKISDFVPTSSGGTPSRTHSEYYSDGTNLWVKTQELNDGFIFDTEEKITDDAIRNSSAKIIPQGSILMAMYGATIGKIGIAATELTCNQACCVFNLSKIKYATSYLYCWLKDNREFFISQGKGAAQPNLSQAMIKNFDVLIPSADILTTFSQVTDTLLELSAKLHLQNRGLIESRDRLLPKLMSGEIEV